MTLDEYIQSNYLGKYSKKYNKYWFEKEVAKGENVLRISNVLSNINYLKGKHKILNREDMEYKEQKYITKKLILQQAKTILNFHSTYILGKPISITGTEDKVKVYNNIYKAAKYNNIDFRIVDSLNKFGDAYEYVYKENDIIKSKIIKAEDSYPIYSDDNEYIGFIEYYISNNVSFYNIYSENVVEEWTNEGGEIHKLGEYTNVSGLPIHYKNSISELFGDSMLTDIRPILDELEDILSKMGDSIYTLMLNPMPVVTGQKIESNIPSDAVGYALNLDDSATFEYKNAQLDYNSVKMYIDKIQQQLNIIAYMPSIALGNTNVANVSEVSLKLLYQLADVYAMLSEKCIREGMYKRFEIIDKLIGVPQQDSQYIDIEFNYSRPVNTSELLDNIKKQYDMGAISIQSIIEKSNITNDVKQEMDRIREQGNSSSSTVRNS